MANLTMYSLGLLSAHKPFSSHYLYLGDLVFGKRCKHEKTMHFYGWSFHTIDR